MSTMRLLISMIAMAGFHSPCDAVESPTPDDSFAEISSLVPPSAHAAVVFPNIKRCSDNLTRLLEGMDRAGLLMGSRPIDQARSALGYTVAVRETGGAAIIVFKGDDQATTCARIVPVSDSEEFLAANFTDVEEGEGNARRSIDGTVMYARAIDNHIILSEDWTTLRRWDAPAGEHESVFNWFDPFLDAAQSDMVVCIPPEAMVQLLEPALSSFGATAELARPLVETATQQVRSLTLAVTCDPLALLVRSDLRLIEGSVLAPIDEPSDASTDPMDLVPDQASALSFGVNLSAIGGREFLQQACAGLNGDPSRVPNWISHVESFAAGVGSEGGPALLSQTALAIRSTVGGDELLEQILETLRIAGRQVTSSPPPDAIAGSTIESLTVRPREDPAHSIQIAAEAFCFGAGGFRGLASTSGNELIVAGSPAMGVLSSFAQRSATLRSNQAVQFMRQWMPAQRDLEAYCWPEKAAALLHRAPPPFRADADALPAFDALAPPIGIASDWRRQSITSTLILPAQVLAPAVDHAVRQRRLRDSKNNAAQTP